VWKFLEMAIEQKFLLTGATSGLGLATAQAIATAKASNQLIVGARHPSDAHALRKAVPEEQLVIFELDTSSVASVHAFAQQVREHCAHRGLAGLALNAGIQIVSGDQFSVDGFELTFATNVLGHIALVDQLMPNLSPKAVIVSTASGTHDKDHKLAKPYNFFGGFFPSPELVAAGKVSTSTNPAQQGRDRYATSKLCNILFTYAMARELGDHGPRFMAFDPGLMPGTELVRDNTAAVKFAWKNILPTAAKLMDGASTTKASGDMLAQLLTQQHLPTGTGRYVEYTGEQITSSTMSYDQTRQDALMLWTRIQLARG
jgi:NAD(P)-dependent dehydrogenase (short-subunit alcohol dehydrogenase family)